MKSDNSGDGTPRVNVSIGVAYPTVVSFRWAYTSSERSEFDQPRFSVNGKEEVFPGFLLSGYQNQNGNFGPLQLLAGDVFTITAWTLDGAGGACTITVSSFTAQVDRAPVLPCITTGFRGDYLPGTWKITNSFAKSDARVTGFNLSTMQMVSNTVERQNVTMFVTHSVARTSVISFKWTYSTRDRLLYDQPRFALNGEDQAFPGFNVQGSTQQQGSVSLTIQGDKTFSIGVWSVDGLLGACTLTITQFVAKEQAC